MMVVRLKGGVTDVPRHDVLHSLPPSASPPRPPESVSFRPHDLWAAFTRAPEWTPPLGFCAGSHCPPSSSLLLSPRAPFLCKDEHELTLKSFYFLLHGFGVTLKSFPTSACRPRPAFFFLGFSETRLLHFSNLFLSSFPSPLFSLLAGASEGEFSLGSVCQKPSRL